MCDQVEKGALDKSLFLTRQTMEGLRITLQSTIDLVQHLTENCQFKFVLTGNINQDALEVIYLFVKINYT